MTQEEERTFFDSQIDDEKVAEHTRRSFKLENMLKNVVIEKLVEIRAKK
jgi:hypothetical protein